MNTSDKLKTLQTLRAEVAKLEAYIAANQQAELAGLPAKYGFDTTADFIAAVRSATRGGRGRKAAVGKSGRRRRAKITDETRATVKKMVGEGKTGAQIAAAVGISLPSVQNIKKALGLVRKGKK
jgi:hypothetical protein